MNINTATYWDEIHESETEEWRDYPFTFECVEQEVSSSDEVVELGCGTGILAKKIADKVFSYRGFDISKIAAEKAKAKGINAAQLDATVDEIPKGDVLIALEFLEHFKDEELAEMLPRIKEAASKALFAVPNDCLGNEDCKEHYQKFSKESFRELLTQYYEDVVIIDYVDKVKNKPMLPTLFAICRRQRK